MFKMFQSLVAYLMQIVDRDDAGSGIEYRGWRAGMSAFEKERCDS